MNDLMEDFLETVQYQDPESGELFEDFPEELEEEDEVFE